MEVDTVELDWFEAEKKRIRKTTAGGRDIGIAIDENLKDGDIIYLDDKLCVAVKLTSCPLIKINVHTMQEMGRLCFEIGNRHLSLKYLTTTCLSHMTSIQKKTRKTSALSARTS